MYQQRLPIPAPTVVQRRASLQRHRPLRRIRVHHKQSQPLPGRRQKRQPLPIRRPVKIMRRAIRNQRRQIILINHPTPPHRGVNDMYRQPQRTVARHLNPGNRQPRPVRRPGRPSPAFRQLQPLRPVSPGRPAAGLHPVAAASQTPNLRAVRLDGEQIPIRANISNAVNAHSPTLRTWRYNCRGCRPWRRRRRPHYHNNRHRQP